MISHSSSQRLRTKTGCLTCRLRRRKCDEQVPVCRGCQISGRQCDWPTSADLLDRRFFSHSQSRHRKSHREGKKQRDGSVKDTEIESKSTQTDALTSIFDERVSFSFEASLAQNVVTRDLEALFYRHFFDNYSGLLILPGCHPDYQNGWLTAITTLMDPYQSLYCAVMACAASHIQSLRSCTRMQEVSLTYYSSAITKLSRALTTASQPRDYDGLLMSIMLLYIHGCMGWGTYSDISRHLDAATSIVDSRLLKQPIGVDLPVDMLVVESILYHAFHVATGLWSDVIGSDYTLNLDFWLRAEARLSQPSSNSESPSSYNSPVLGVPVALLRLAMLLRQKYRLFSAFTITEIEDLENEVSAWEAVFLRDQKPQIGQKVDMNQGNADGDYCEDASALYAIIVSLLLGQAPRSEPGPPLEASGDDFRIRRAIEIIKRHETDDGWAKCFIGNWPTYTLGFFMSRSQDAGVIRNDLQRRWDLTKMSQVQRFCNDLEATWADRCQNLSFSLSYTHS